MTPLTSATSPGVPPKTCEYVELGAPGPPDNELQLAANDYVGELELDRRGGQIAVSSEGSTPLACTGGSPSVDNLDRITIRSRPNDLDALIVDLRGGLLEPGATPEPDGSGEIEISLERSPGTVLAIRGTRGSDHIQLGSIGSGRYGANLNAATEESRDADVTARTALVFATLGHGDDRIDPSGRAAFATGRFKFAFSAYGGSGDDVLVGNDALNAFLGRQGSDRLVGGGRRDFLIGGAESDGIDARDGVRDKILCGPGVDSVRADRLDKPVRCERR